MQTHLVTPGITRREYSSHQRLYAMLVAVLLGAITALTVFLGVSGGQKTAHADANWGVPMFCSAPGLGNHMDGGNAWESPLTRIPSSDKAGRTLTLQEAFGSNLYFVNYQGEGDGTQWTREANNKNLDDISGKTDDVKDKLEGIRTAPTCFSGGLVNGLGNFLLSTSNFLAAVSEFFVTSAFDPKIFCDNASDTGCINVVKIVGGEGSNSEGGIIGALTSGLLIPLSTVMAIIAAVLMVIDVLRTRAVRQFFVRALSLVFVYVFGLMFALNPMMVAKIPQTVGNTLTSLIVTPFVDATDTPATDDGTASGAGVCQADAPGVSESEQMSLTMASLNCRIWKAFVLGPYAQASFGRSYESLQLSNSDISKAVSDAGYSPEDYDVPLKSMTALDEQSNKQLKLDGSSPKVRNLAAYQLYLQTNAAKPGDENFHDQDVDARWYRVILPVAHNDSMWDTWTFSFASAFRRLAFAGLSLFSAALGTFLIAFTAILALVWLFVTMLVICLLPLFLLIGLEQTRGRRLLFKFLAEMGSIIAKYLLSLVLVIVTVVVYGAVLGSIDDAAMAFLGVIVMTLAMLIMRERIMGLFGDLSLLGTGRVGNNISRRVGSVARSVRSAAGGAAGGALAERSLRPGAFARGAWDATKRDIKRTDGFTANALRQADRISEDNKADMRARAQMAGQRGQQHLDEANRARQEYRAHAANTEQIADEHDALAEQVNNLTGHAEVVHKVENQVTGDFRAQGGNAAAFADLQDLRNELQQAQVAFAAAQAAGADAGDLASRSQDISRLRGDVNARENLLGSSMNLSAMEADYNARLAAELTGRGMQDFTEDDAARVVGFANRISALQSQYNAEVTQAQDTRRHYDEMVDAAATESGRQDALNNEYLEWKPGQFVSNKRAQQVSAAAEEAKEAYAAEHRDRHRLPDLDTLGGTADQEQYRRGRDVEDEGEQPQDDGQQGDATGSSAGAEEDGHAPVHDRERRTGGEEGDPDTESRPEDRPRETPFESRDEQSSQHRPQDPEEDGMPYDDAEPVRAPSTPEPQRDERAEPQREERAQDRPAERRSDPETKPRRPEPVSESRGEEQQKKDTASQRTESRTVPKVNPLRAGRSSEDAQRPQPEPQRRTAGRQVPPRPVKSRRSGGEPGEQKPSPMEQARQRRREQNEAAGDGNPTRRIIRPGEPDDAARPRRIFRPGDDD